jgi:hypothetical protein
MSPISGTPPVRQIAQPAVGGESRALESNLPTVIPEAAACSSPDIPFRDIIPANAGPGDYLRINTETYLH